MSIATNCNDYNTQIAKTRFTTLKHECNGIGCGDMNYKRFKVK